jgi:hypothetical protein
MGQRETIWALEAANRRTFRAFQLKEELRDILALPLIQTRDRPWMPGWRIHHGPISNRS